MDALFGIAGPDFVVMCADKTHVRSIVKVDVSSFLLEMIYNAHTSRSHLHILRTRLRRTPNAHGVWGWSEIILLFGAQNNMDKLRVVSESGVPRKLIGAVGEIGDVHQFCDYVERNIYLYN
eukprot:SAG11_NODE_19965_length_455_cov_1.148876_1_plen_120_part_01